MTPEFEEALGLWESGELSRDELARRFPDEDLAGLLDSFERMSAASAAPTPEAADAWAAVRTRLPVRLADRRRGRGKAIRLLAAALIAVLVLGASAYAVVPSVRRALNDAATAITSDSDPSSHPTRPAENDDLADEPTRNISDDDDGSTTDPDEDAAGENDGDADELDTDDDADAGSNGAEDVGDSGSGSDDGSLDDGSDQDGGSGDSGSGEERASGGIDNDGSGSGSEDPES